MGDIVATYDENGNATHRYLHGPAVDQIFSDESAVDGLLWALADQQGTVKDWADYDEATDATSIYNHVEYDSFGNIENQSNAAHEITVGYTGRYIDPVTGLQWNRGRWYDPGMGRFVSGDPIGFGGGDVNLVRYVGNGPTNFTDPNGLQQRKGPPGYGSPIGSSGGYSRGKPTIGYLIGTTLFGRMIQIGKLSDEGDLNCFYDTNGEFEEKFKPDIRTIILRMAQIYRERDIPENGLNVRRSVRSIKNPNGNGQWSWTSNEAFDAGWWLNGAHSVDADIRFTVKKIDGEIQLCNIRSKWSWNDVIDARGVLQWWEAKENWGQTFKGVPNLIIESIFWDKLVDGLLDADFQIKVNTPWIDTPNLSVSYK